jgi:hypothetical protein
MRRHFIQNSHYLSHIPKNTKKYQKYQSKKDRSYFDVTTLYFKDASSPKKVGANGSKCKKFFSYFHQCLHCLSADSSPTKILGANGSKQKLWVKKSKCLCLSLKNRIFGAKNFGTCVC